MIKEQTKSGPLIENSDFCALKFMKTCLVAVGFGHFFAQVQGFWKNFAQPKFYTCSISVPTFVYRESTHPSGLNFFVYHSSGKTGQVLFLNACNITTFMQTKGNNCKVTASGRRADACAPDAVNIL